jgi:hypothetical protein
MAGTAPTRFHFTKMLDAGPVHCSVWLGITGWPAVLTHRGYHLVGFVKDG